MKNYNKKILEAVNRGIKFALDDFEDQESIQGQFNSKVNHKHGTKEWLDLMEEAVDLDLPSGTLWCKYNLGVDQNQLSKLEGWYGDYYAWGELEGNKTNKDDIIYFGWDNYKFGKSYDKLTKYCYDSKYGLNGFIDNLMQLQLEDDIACRNKKLYNFKFHIPTKEQCEELIKYTQNYWVKNYNPNKIKHNLENDNGIQGLNGYIFEGKSGNQLFIPAAGYRINFDIINIGSHGGFWSSNLSLGIPDYAFYLYFDSNYIDVYGGDRNFGRTIRPVINL